MKYDLTTQVDVGLMEKWLSTKENGHLATGHVGTHLDTYEKSDIPLDYTLFAKGYFGMYQILQKTVRFLSQILKIHTYQKMHFF